MELPLELVDVHKEWRGWSMGRDGLLCFEGWRRGIEPGELAGLLYRVALVGALERANAALRSECERRVAESEGAERLVFFYRAQVLGQSRLGFLLGLLGD